MGTVAPRALALLVGGAWCAAACGSGGAGTADAASGADAPSGADATSAADAADAGTDAGPALGDFDLGRDFSLAANPNGPWRYGYTSGSALVAASFQMDTFAVDALPVGFWHPSGAQDGYYPYVAANRAAVTSTDPTGSWAVRPDEVAMEGSASGQYSVVQLVVPAAGTYQLAADFAGVHTRLSTTDVHVLRGEVALFDAVIDGYGGDPAFRAVTGASPTASYHATLDLGAGDVLTFAVGVGANGTNANDTTGLVVRLGAP
jgi:hypothetical protein